MGPKSKNKIKKSGGAKLSKISMTPQFKQWCQTEMLKLMGSPDLTLVNFLMTVEDPSKVRDYVRAYMASKAGHEEFTNRFLLERDFANEELTKKKSLQKVNKASQRPLSQTDVASKVLSSTGKKIRRRKKKS